MRYEGAAEPPRHSSNKSNPPAGSSTWGRSNFRSKRKSWPRSVGGCPRGGESSNPNLIPLGGHPPAPPSPEVVSRLPSSPSASSVASFVSCHSELTDEDESPTTTTDNLSQKQEKGYEEMQTQSRRELEEAYGKLDLNIEDPCQVNGMNFQIRTLIFDQLFIGRSPTLEEATERCCAKALKYMKQHRLGPYKEANSSLADKKDRRRKRKVKKGDENGEGSNSKETSAEEKKVDFRNIPIKNAIMMLNEMFPPPKAPQYKVLSQTGPPNNPTFTMMCTIDNNSYVGEGKSKKEAKLVSSQKAIEVLCGYKQSETRSVPEKSNPRANCDLDDWMELEGKNPVSILNELYPGIQYQLLSTTGPSHAPNFIIKAILNNMSFEGSGKSKKDAKLNASKALLVHLHKVGFDPMTGDMMSTRENNDAAAIGHTFADQISQLVHYKYQELFGTTTYSKRRVMAAIVMTEEEKDPNVIAVTSGTKCINGEQISLEGCVINDSHAEIVARRCLLLFLYSHLEKLSNEEEEDSIFYRLDGSPRCTLKKGIEFHLFITTSPCGDARIFSLHEASTKTFKEEKQQERTKSEEKDDGGQPSETSSEEYKRSFVIVDENNNEIVNPGNDDVAEWELLDENNNVVVDGEPKISWAEENSKQQLNEKVILLDENNNVVQEVDENNNIVLDPKNPGSTQGQVDCYKLLDDDIDNNNVTEEVTLSDVALANENPESIKTSSSSASLSENNVVEKKSSDSSRGMLRSKIECGMGTVPISPKIQIQTWDGVMSGDRLLTMACSDKLLRWNVLGVQGACLTHLIYPIYFSTITVGSKFHPGHMKRALYDRIESHINNLPEGYKMNNADLLATTSPETRQATKAHDYSVNWVIDHGQPEIVNGSTGKTISDNVSRLSKKMLFQKFLDLNGRILKEPFDSPCRYSEVKQSAEEYQEAKSAFNLALKNAGCGVWIDKPIEQDQFSL